MNRKTMILWILVILLMLGFAVTQTPQAEQEQAQPAEPPTSGEELRTDGWAWTQAHAGIDNAAILVGGPLQVQVNNVPGQDTAFWIFPGPRELDPHVFGTPDKPLGYAPPFPLYGVPLDLRGITEDGSSFTQTTQPTAFSNNWTGVQGASVGMTVVDVTATEEQASSGAAWYQEHCAQCHGNNLAGVARNPALRGDAFLQDFGNVQALFNFIRTKMPFPHPGELAEQTYLDITAYILRQNGFPTGDQPLTADQQLQQLRLSPEAAQVAERSDPEEPAEIDEPRSVNPFTGDQAAIEEGRQLYFDYKCAGCHGAEGGGSIGPSHTDNFWIYGAHDEAIFDVIRNGRIGMPPFENFEDEEIWKIVAFIRSLNQGLGGEF